MATQTRERTRTGRVNARVRPETLEMIKALIDGGIGKTTTQIIEKGVESLCDAKGLKLYARLMASR